MRESSPAGRGGAGGGPRLRRRRHRPRRSGHPHPHAIPAPFPRVLPPPSPAVGARYRHHADPDDPFWSLTITTRQIDFLATVDTLRRFGAGVGTLKSSVTRLKTEPGSKLLKQLVPAIAQVHELTDRTLEQLTVLDLAEAVAVNPLGATGFSGEPLRVAATYWRIVDRRPFCHHPHSAAGGCLGSKTFCGALGWEVTARDSTCVRPRGIRSDSPRAWTGTSPRSATSRL
ncbi:hypothetical protein [Streptomyces achromogenes]|uniref:hypothetical protein n=1 Tax=Streptomyces achromogenes TaxID=67255 RepID=UPI0036B985CE